MKTLDELSKKILGSYLNKARKTVPALSKKYDDEHEASKKKDPKVYDHEDPHGDKLHKSFHSLNKRMKGMSKANDKLKEEVEMSNQREFLDAVLSSDDTVSETLFQKIIAQKVNSALDGMRTSVAKSIFKGSDE